MFCSNCGKEIKDESKFCKYCGTKVNKPVIDNKIEFNESKITAKNSVKMNNDENKCAPIEKKYDPKKSDETVALNEETKDSGLSISYSNKISLTKSDENNLEKKSNISLLDQNEKPKDIKNDNTEFLNTQNTNQDLEKDKTIANENIEDSSKTTVLEQEQTDSNKNVDSKSFTNNNDNQVTKKESLSMLLIVLKVIAGISIYFSITKISAFGDALSNISSLSGYFSGFSSDLDNMMGNISLVFLIIIVCQIVNSLAAAITIFLNKKDIIKKCTISVAIAGVIETLILLIMISVIGNTIDDFGSSLGSFFGSDFSSYSNSASGYITSQLGLDSAVLYTIIQYGSFVLFGILYLRNNGQLTVDSRYSYKPKSESFKTVSDKIQKINIQGYTLASISTKSYLFMLCWGVGALVYFTTFDNMGGYSYAGELAKLVIILYGIVGLVLNILRIYIAYYNLKHDDANKLNVNVHIMIITAYMEILLILVFALFITLFVFKTGIASAIAYIISTSLFPILLTYLIPWLYVNEINKLYPEIHVNYRELMNIEVMKEYINLFIANIN